LAGRWKQTTHLRDEEVYALLDKEIVKIQAREQVRLKATLEQESDTPNADEQSASEGSATILGKKMRIPRFVALCTALGLSDTDRRIMEIVFVYQVPPFQSFRQGPLPQHSTPCCQ
jgi:hypothetical protein